MTTRTTSFLLAICALVSAPAWQACQSGSPASASPAAAAETPTLGTYSAAAASARLDALAARMERHVGVFAVDSLAVPRSVEPDGTVRGVKTRDWTSGFFPGTLWLLADASGSGALRAAAEAWTPFLVKEKRDDHTHDLGFKVNNSLGHARTLGGRADYADDIVEASAMLLRRYDPDVRTIRSWDWGKKHGWQHPTIIDNMMNLEMLFEATRLSGDSSFHRVAVAHADRTLAEHFREDASSYHVVDYDTATGAVRARVTHQGIADESAWARGQAWGLYGFTMAYRYTRDPRYLGQASRVADFFFGHPNTPADRVPYFDFDAEPGDDTPRDASAAALAASAALELATLDPERRDSYVAWADAILSTLERPEYQASTAPFLITRATGNYPAADEIDVPINYADYYYVEALRRRAALE